jgi:predicted ATPase
MVMESGDGLNLALGAERPVVLFVDDLQWCDAESCALLQFLIRRLDEAPVLLLATITAGELEAESAPRRLAESLFVHPRARRLALAPLTEDEVWQLIRRMGNIRAPAGGRRFARRLHHVSDGNPFQVIEVAKMLFTEGLLGATPVSREWVLPATRASGGFARVDIPRSVRDAIGMRISRLPDELRQLLASIAVAARPVGAEVLAHVHGSSRLRVAALAESLIERHLVEDQHGYRMAHPLLGQAVRAGLSAARLRELHRALSLALEASASPGRLEPRASDIAWHAERGGEPTRAYRFALLGSEAAAAELAFEEASSCLALARRAMPEAGTELDERLKALAERAGWTAPPAAPAADPHIPPIGEEDLDLRVEEAPR